MFARCLDQTRAVTRTHASKLAVRDRHRDRHRAWENRYYCKEAERELVNDGERW